MSKRRARYTEHEQQVEAAAKLTDQITPILAGHGSPTQSAALALLCAMWVCGHHPAESRPMVLRIHVNGIKRMVRSINEAEARETRQ